MPFPLANTPGLEPWMQMPIDVPYPLIDKIDAINDDQRAPRTQFPYQPTYGYGLAGTSGSLVDPLTVALDRLDGSRLVVAEGELIRPDVTTAPPLRVVNPVNFDAVIAQLLLQLQGKPAWKYEPVAVECEGLVELGDILPAPAVVLLGINVFLVRDRQRVDDLGCEIVTKDIGIN